MKKIILVFITLLSINSFGQNFSFNLSDGSSDFVVYEVDKKPAAELYQKTLNWVNETYKNPDVVIKAKVENEMIRIEGTVVGAFKRTYTSGSTADYDTTYTLEFQFQDGKYRTKFTHQTITIDGYKVYFTLTDMLNNIIDINGNNYNGCKEQYEKYVQTLIDYHNTYVTKPKEKW